MTVMVVQYLRVDGVVIENLKLTVNFQLTKTRPSFPRMYVRNTYECVQHVLSTHEARVGFSVPEKVTNAINGFRQVEQPVPLTSIDLINGNARSGWCLCKRAKFRTFFTVRFFVLYKYK